MSRKKSSFDRESSDSKIKEKGGECSERLLSFFAENMLPIKGIRITLRANRAVSTRFQHAHALSAWIRTLAGSEDVEYLRIDAIETGHVQYRENDLYQFSLFSVAPGLPLLNKIIDRLNHAQANPDDNNSKSDLAFGSHWTIAKVQDWFDERDIKTSTDLAAYDIETLLEEANIWQKAAKDKIIWQWLSPVRLLKPVDQRGKGELRYCRDVADVNASLLFERFTDSLNQLARNMGATIHRDSDELPVAASESHDVFWIEDEYHPANGKGKAKGGLLGRHVISVELTTPWAGLLVLAQYLGVGQGVFTGMGRFRLETSDGRMSLRRGHPQRNWLERSLDDQNLYDAWRHVRESRQSIPVDAIGIGEIEDQYAAELDHPASPEIAGHADTTRTVLDVLASRLEALKRGQYVAPPAKACLLPKNDGGTRILAIPPFWDSVLQRAVAQQLTPSLDSLMHPSSFGYRRGRSRRAAAEAIQAARRQGYRWIYDADIEDFFGSVSHSRLHGRLLALFDDDPIIDIIMAWVTAPISWQGENHPRKQGLPQGSNLSPLLANLMLDDFDNDMSVNGIKLVRFADDFVLMCKSKEKAEAAALVARRSLQEHGFELHKGKSRIADLDQGLEFLGYLFVDDYAIDTSRNRIVGVRNKPSRSGKQADMSIHMAGWLAKLSQQPARALSERELSSREANSALSSLKTDSAYTVGEQFDPYGSLYVVGHGHMVYTDGGHVVVAKNDERVSQRPWKHLNHIFLMGNQHITTPAMRVAAREQVDVYATSGHGKLQFSVVSAASSSTQRLWLRQAVAAEDAEFCVPIAREIVAARIRHQFEIVRQRDETSSTSKGPTVTELLRQLSKASDLQMINGVEGYAAASFFDKFSLLIPEKFSFTGRKRRPPPDPVNALLSIGYQVLYAHANTFLRSEKLLPAFGVYHRAGRDHAALGSDMIEPFRHLVERNVLNLLRRGSLTPEDFSSEGSTGMCLVHPSARRRFVADLHTRLSKELKPRGEEQVFSLRTLMHRQCHSIALAIDHADAQRFQVFRQR